MKLKFVLIMTLLISHCAISQEIFLKSGKNFTKYNYKNSSGQNLVGLESSSGSNYELGVEFFLDGTNNSLESRYSYSVSLTLNQFNAKGGNINNTYVWNTNYLGIQNMVYASILKTQKRFMNFKAKAGFNMATIVSGEQFINNVVYDLKKYKEFKGVIIQPTIGADFRFEINRELNVNFGYSLSKAFNISNKSSEKLSFTNNQLQLGLTYTLY